MHRLSNRFFVLFCWSVSILPFSVPHCASGFQFGKELSGISGRVYDEQTQQILSRVEVTLRGARGMMQAQVVTNQSGRFEFGNFARGEYQIEARMGGYEPYSVAVHVGGGESQGIMIYLKRLPASLETPSGSTVSAHELSMPKKARDLMYSGKQKVYFDKNLDGGLTDFQNAAAVAPGYYEAYYQIGMTYLQLNQRSEAEKSFRKSIELSKDTYGEPVIGMGTILIDKGDNAGGEKMIRRGVELSPNFWLGYYELGRACLAENHIADAKKAAEQARSLMPNAAMIYRLLANVHTREKDYPALLADIDMYLKIDPDSPAGAHAKEMRAEVIQNIRNEKVVSENEAPK
ncbi:MAG TPA: tetratricopeptide repeat protein [Candidatus Acidoferrales bacterium]|nr:tetratricopeptide repeat protein [Candidatus Acidoferrales bacterium]